MSQGTERYYLKHKHSEKLVRKLNWNNIEYISDPVTSYKFQNYPLSFKSIESLKDHLDNMIFQDFNLNYCYSNRINFYDYDQITIVKYSNMFFSENYLMKDTALPPFSSLNVVSQIKKSLFKWQVIKKFDLPLYNYYNQKTNLDNRELSYSYSDYMNNANTTILHGPTSALNPFQNHKKILDLDIQSISFDNNNRVVVCQNNENDLNLIRLCIDESKDWLFTPFTTLTFLESRTYNEFIDL